MAATALLFDLEGTLCDTRRWYAEILEREFGQPRSEILKRLEGGRAPTFVAADCGVDRESLMWACRRAAADVPTYPGVRKLLAALRMREVPTAVVTNLPRNLAEVILAGAEIGSFFDVLVAWKFGVPPKPHPAPVLQALEQLEVVAAPTVVLVGDQQVDADSAVAAGIGFAWAKYGYAKSRPNNATAVIARFTQVLAL